MDAAPLIEMASAQMPDEGVQLALERATREGRAPRIKFGMDPTAPDLHLGHMVLLQRLRAFQDAGCTVVLIIGDFTAGVGDPTGRSKSRPPLSREQIEENAKTFCDQAFRVLDRERCELRFNSEWLDELGSRGLLALLARGTVGQMLTRKDFSDRLASGEPLSVMEIVYPLLQGHDSVHVKADVETGGHDQLLNLLAGRPLQEQAGQPPQAVVCWPLLIGLDGQHKMSKSMGNHVALIDEPATQFGQIMSISDELMVEWADLLMVPALDGRSFAKALEGGWHPMQAKRHLARTIIERIAGRQAAEDGEQAFNQVFLLRQQPDEIPTLAMGELELNERGQVFLPQLIVAQLGGSSRAQARSTISGGGLRIDDKVHTGPLEVAPSDLAGRTLRVGRRNWLRVTS